MRNETAKTHALHADALNNVCMSQRAVSCAIKTSLHCCKIWPNNKGRGTALQTER